jgi:hypothetical protein
MAKSATTLSRPVFLSVSISYWIIVSIFVIAWNTTNSTYLVHGGKQDERAAITEANFEEVAAPAPPAASTAWQESVDTPTKSIDSHARESERIAVEAAKNDKARELPQEPKVTPASEAKPAANKLVMSEPSNKPAIPNQASHRPSSIPSDFKIVAGETAPQYRLLDQRSVECLLNRYGGRLLLTDGSHAFDIGNDIRNPIENTSSINSDKWWEANYSTRVALIPKSYGFNSVMNKLPRLPIRRDACDVVLAVPNSVDRSIFEAQIKFFEGNVDVNATTIVEVDYSGIRVRGLLKQGE